MQNFSSNSIQQRVRGGRRNAGWKVNYVISVRVGAKYANIGRHALLLFKKNGVSVDSIDTDDTAPTRPPTSCSLRNAP